MAWGAAGAFAGSAISAGASYAESKKQRKFIKKMRATAYQATMKDMRAAGLNPILAYKTGPTPIGSAAAGLTPDFGQAMASGVNAATRAKTGVKERELLGQKKLTEVQRGLREVYTARIEGEKYNADIGRETVRKLASEVDLNSARAILLQAEIPRAEAIKRMDESATGQYLNQATTGIRRATGAIGAILGGGAAAKRLAQ